MAPLFPQQNEELMFTVMLTVVNFKYGQTFILTNVLFHRRLLFIVIRFNSHSFSD